MKSRARLLGHAIHPILIVFPLGLLITGVVFDAIYRFWGNAELAGVAHWMIAAGIVGGVLAAAFGLIDWLAIAPKTRAKTIGGMHGIGNTMALLLFIGSWWLQNSAPTRPAAVASILSFVSLAVVGVGGCLGRELVERLVVGVDEGADLNAPSSLTHDTTRPVKG